MEKTSNTSMIYQETIKIKDERHKEFKSKVQAISCPRLLSIQNQSAVLSHSFRILGWTNEELTKMDIKSEKLMSMSNIVYKHLDMDKLYASRQRMCLLTLGYTFR